MRIGNPRTTTADRFTNRLNGVILADNDFLQMRFKMSEKFLLGATHAVNWDASF